MNQSTTTDNSPLELYPPKIQGQTEPVKGAHVGVPLVAYDLVSDGEGAKVQIDPPLVGIWESEDVVKLWLVNDTTLLSFTTIGDPNVPIFLRIPRNRLHPDEVNQLYYTVERNSNNTGTSEPPLQVLYNRIRPGLKDRFPEIDGHSELELDLSDLIKQGVGKDFVSAPVCFSYPYCRAYDTISLKCNGEIETFPVSKDQAPEPPNPGSEMPTTVCFTVEREFLDKAKRQNKVLNFSYSVTDQLLNGPDPDAVWSAAVAVNEDLDGVLLPMPILLERKEDYPGDIAETIDLEKLADGPLLLVVLTDDKRFVVGYDVIATYTATNTGQPDAVVVTVSSKVEADRFGVKQTLFLEVPNDKVFAGSSVTATYELRKPDGDLVGSSNTATATVTDAPPIKLLPPFLVDAVEPIDVLAYPNGVKIRIEYRDARKADRARQVEVNPPAGSPQFPLVEFNSEKQVDTVLSVAFMAARHEKNIGFRWNLNRNNAQAGKSPVATFSVLKIADGDSRLPMPNVTQSPDSKTLNLNDFTGDAEVTLRPWLGISTDQLINLECTGTDNLGAPYTIDLLTNNQVTADNVRDGFIKKLLRNELNKFKDNSEIHFEAKFDFPQSNDTPTISLPVLTLTLITVPNEILVNFDSEPSQTLSSGQSYETQYVTITNASSSYPISLSPAVGSGDPALKNIEGQVVFTSLGSCTIHFNFKNTYTYISFYQAWGNVTNRANYYNSKGVFLGYTLLAPTERNPAQLIEFRSTDIARVEIITNNDAIAVDNFKCIK